MQFLMLPLSFFYRLKITKWSFLYSMWDAHWRMMCLLSRLLQARFMPLRASKFTLYFKITIKLRTFVLGKRGTDVFPADFFLQLFSAIREGIGRKSASFCQGSPALKMNVATDHKMRHRSQALWWPQSPPPWCNCRLEIGLYQNDTQIEDVTRHHLLKSPWSPKLGFQQRLRL